MILFTENLYSVVEVFIQVTVKSQSLIQLTVEREEKAKDWVLKSKSGLKRYTQN